MVVGGSVNPKVLPEIHSNLASVIIGVMKVNIFHKACKFISFSSHLDFMCFHIRKIDKSLPEKLKIGLRFFIQASLWRGRCWQVKGLVLTVDWWLLVALTRWPLARDYLKNKKALYMGIAVVMVKWSLVWDAVNDKFYCIS